MEKPVAILGCGPAGLFAAHAIAQLGAEFVIFSVKQKSVIAGAQYLQKPVPGIAELTRPDGYIKTVLLGDKFNYAKRVYGDAHEATSWPEFPPEPEPAWDLRKAYDKAWDLYHNQVIDQRIDGDEVADMTARFPVVINTIPAWSICQHQRTHEFRSMNILVSDQMEYTGLPNLWTEDEHVVVYNGTEEGDWYRTAKIFGHQSAERVYIQGNGVPQGYMPGFKILGNTCDCHPNLTRTGRLGTWSRGVLTHMAFEHAAAAYMERTAV